MVNTSKNTHGAAQLRPFDTVKQKETESVARWLAGPKMADEQERRLTWNRSWMGRYGAIYQLVLRLKDSEREQLYAEAHR